MKDSENTVIYAAGAVLWRFQTNELCIRSHCAQDLEEENICII